MEPRLIFVYGTLKRPYGNSTILERASRFIGDAVTQGKYYLANCGFPYLISDYLLRDDKRGLEKNVLGQVWEVSDEATMASLDRLEGVSSNHYQHHILYVNHLETDEVLKVLAYHAGYEDAQEYPPSNTTEVNGEEVYSWAR